jgi:hypothetical protein
MKEKRTGKWNEYPIKYGTWVVVDRIIYIQIVGLLKKQKQNI